MLILKIREASRKIKEEDLTYFKKSGQFKNLNMNKILLVGMLDSPHFRKWVRELEKEFPTKKILIFPSDRPKIKVKFVSETNSHKKSNIKIFRLIHLRKMNFSLFYVLDLLAGYTWRAYFLALFIIKHKPGIIHFHEMQHGAYIYNLIVNYKRIPDNCRTIISTWGSDLVLYSWVDKHQSSIKACLSWVDILTAEREVDLIDARRLGFNGEFRAPIYITLGQSFSERKVQVMPSLRKLILIKGHQSNTGLALNVLHAISQIGIQLIDFEILVYSAPESVQIQVDTLRNKNKINIRFLARISHDEMCNMFYRARVSISLAVSDGLPGVLLEAMQAGAFPIQSSNSAGKDFIVHGRNGFLVEPWDIESIKECIVASVSNNELVDHASKLNKQILQEKYSLTEGLQKLRELYL